MKVTTSSKFINEKKYILDVILGDFLGLEFSHETSDDYLGWYLISFENGTSIKIKDCFFDNQSESVYWTKGNIPDAPTSVSNKINDNNLVFIYGEDVFSISDNNTKITTHYDFFSSAFFMLSRWEEIAHQERDEHNRFPDQEAFVIKHNIYKRPIVNEYCVFISQLMELLGVKSNLHKKKYQAYITHDVDGLVKYNNPINFLKALGGDIILRRKPLLTIKTTKDYFLIKSGKKKDSYDTYDYLMDISEKYNLKSRFYFIPSIKGEFDFRYDIRSKEAQEIVKKILAREHVVGIHPSYKSFNNAHLFKKEVDRMRSLNAGLSEGRQHFLRFENPVTWNLWENNGLTSDSTMGFINHIGFRCGVCYEYPVFDVLTRKKLTVYEYPLLIMEGALRLYVNNNTSEFLDQIKLISRITKKYNGNLVFLWHNNNINHSDWVKYSCRYEEVIKLIA